MEFVRGSTMNSVDPDTLRGWLTETSFEDIGKIFVLDVIINNFDRIPGNMWSNDGNIGNLMITKNGRVYGIDQGVVAPANEEAVAAYLNKVSLNFGEFKQDPSGCKMVEEILNFVNSNTGSVADPQSASAALSRGIRFVVDKLQSISQEDVDKMKSTIVNSIRVDWENIWKDMCDSVHVDFLVQVIQTIVKATSSDSEVKQD
eukprot:TRINITY_DN989_c0_g2_i1.p1 TRINITY_DN989_c0_g2~~TRINITY_DN989_c0_g2_i1.p1  ORF type:complete len:202 (+),score=65.27 TRINITY_DN989_c0_g2_i1:712-1317(+)